MENKLQTTKLSIFHALVKGLLHSTIFFIGIHLKSIGFSGIEIGIIFMTYSLTGLISILPSGLSNDVFKSKNIITIGLLLLTIQYIGMANFTTFASLIPCFFLGSLGKTLYGNSMDSLFLKTTNKEHAGKRISTFLSLNYLLIAISIIISGYFLNLNIQFTSIFIVIGISFAIMAILSQIILPKNATSKFEILNYKKDIFKPDVLFFLFIMFLFALHYGSEETSYGLFLENSLNLNKLQSGLYMGTAIITMSISVLLISKLIKKIGTKNLLLLGTSMSGLGLILMTIPIPSISLFFRIIHETGDAMMFFFLYYGLSQIFDLKRIGGNAGIVTFIIIIGTSIGNLLLGPIGANYGYQVPFLIGGITTLLTFVFSLKFKYLIKH
ncbi:MAG: MFS transporter [Candidatus Gracilibacteria bacterium]|nr:MFS transporter [Candidatus Gracilibacteria bacterium]